MTVTSKVLVQAKQVENTPTTQYTSVGCKTIIDKPLVTNTSGGVVSFSANLVPSGGSPDATNQVAKDVSLAAGATYLFPEIAGARMDAGDFLSMSASAATSLTFRMDGRQVTAA